MDTKRILSVVLAIINVLASFFFLPIWLEYGEALVRKDTNRLTMNNIVLDSIVMLLSLVSIILNTMIVVRYAGKLEVRLLTPVVTFLIYGIVFSAQFIVGKI